MSYYALTDSDWPWDDDCEGRAIVVCADSPQQAVKIATEKHIAENPGAGGIDWKVARLWNVGFEGVDWEDDNAPNYDGFNFYPEGSNGPMDAPPSPEPQVIASNSCSFCTSSKATTTANVACVQALLNSLDRTSIAKIVDPSAWINEGGYDIEQVHSGPALIAADQIITYVLRAARALATTEGSNNG